MNISSTFSLGSINRADCQHKRCRFCVVNSHFSGPDLSLEMRELIHAHVESTQHKVQVNVSGVLMMGPGFDARPILGRS